MTGHDTAIITGSAGFIGSHLGAALLARGRRVVGVDNFDAFYDRAAKRANVDRVYGPKLGKGDSRPPGAIHIEADIRECKRMHALFAEHRPSTVFHIAALAGVRPSIAEPARYASVNIDGLISVLDAARAAGCRNIIFASSSSVYGNNRKVPFAETDAVDEPISPYAVTKRAGELICHTYAHLFGLRIATLRFFTVYGPAQRPDLAISKFMRLIATGEEVPMFGDGSTSRDYTYIDDIIQGILASEAAAAACGGAHARPHEARSIVDDQTPAGPGFFRIWNLGGSHPITLADMIDTIARTVGRPAKIKRLPMQPGDVERTWADLTRSGAELNFQPRTSFEEGVRRQWEWLRGGLREPAASATI
jgi:UDP-glucuronate 4-epimerase